MTTKKQTLKNKFRNIVFVAIIILLILILVFSIYKIENWVIESNRISEQIKLIEKETIIDNEDTQIIDSTIKPTTFDQYGDYIKMNLINVNFDNLKEINILQVGYKLQVLI